jgi:hypothetical protein
MYYIKAKLNVAEQSVKSYHRLKKINLDEDWDPLVGFFFY